MDKIYKHSRLYLYGFLAIVGLIAIFGDLWMAIEEQEVVFLWV